MKGLNSARDKALLAVKTSGVAVLLRAFKFAGHNFVSLVFNDDEFKNVFALIQGAEHRGTIFITTRHMKHFLSPLL